MRKLTVSIVTYNAGADIRKCLDSLKRQTFRDFKIIIVDNASRDSTVETARLVFPGALVIVLSENRGFGAGHNIAIANSDSDWVLILNQDAELKDDCLEKLMKPTNKSELAAITPLLLRNDTDNTIDTTGLTRNWYYKVIDRGAGNKYEEDVYKSGYVGGVSAACGLYRTKALEEVSYQRTDRDYPEYFDENFFMYKEDVDLAARLNRKGWKAWFEKTAVGFHDRTGHGPKAVSQTKKHREYLPEYISINSYRNHWFFLIKNLPLYSLVPVLGYEAIKFMYLLIFERKTLKGIKEVVGKFKFMLNRRYV